MSARLDQTAVAARTPRGQGERLRERLLDAGVEIVTEHGDESHLTIRAVTKRTGVSPTAFYLHFPTREEFVSALRRRGFEEFRALVAEAAATGGDPAAQLQAAGLGYMRFARERPNIYALIFNPDDPTEHEEWDPDAPGPGSFEDLMARIAAYLDHAGAERADVKHLALAMWTGLHGYVTLRYAPAQKMDWPTDEEFAAQLTEAWLGPAVRGAA